MGGHSWSSSRIGNGEETLDANLSKRVLQLAQGMDFRLTNSNGLGKADVKLELAMLYYCQNFRRVYMFMWEVRLKKSVMLFEQDIVVSVTHIYFLFSPLDQIQCRWGE